MQRPARQLNGQYDNLYQDRRVVLRMEQRLSGIGALASVELLHQMFDKLIANAVDFSESGSEISLLLSVTAGQVVIGVENTGSQLPLPSGELFEPMVSVRDSRDDQPHMGFGLHIVKLMRSDFRLRFHGCSSPGKTRG